MEEAPEESVRCALCGAQNPGCGDVCEACGGQLPGRQGGWRQPAFERALIALLAARSGGAADDGAVEPSSTRSAGAWKCCLASAETVVAVLLRPDETFQSFRLRGGFAPPAAFVTAVGGMAVCVHLLERPRVLPQPFGWWYIPALFLIPVVYAYLRAQAVHVVLVFLGRAREAFEVTFRVVAYTTAAAALLLAVPVAGEFLFLVAGVWIEATGLRRGHGISFEAALLAEVIPAAALLLTAVAVLAMQVFRWSEMVA